MSKFAIVVSLFLLSSQVLAQGDSELSYFKGGRYDSHLSLSNAFFLGVGSHVGGMGGDYGGLVQGSESLLWNPANLAFMRGSQLTMDFIPKLMLNLEQLIDVDSEVRSAVDDNIEDVKGPNFVLGDDDYPEVGIRVGEKASIGTGSFAFRGERIIVAGALYEPLDASFDLLGTGFEARMETIDETDPTKNVTFYSSVDLNAMAKLKLQAASLGVAGLLKPNWSIGVAVERLSGMAQTSARFQVEGIMVIAGNERAFNDAGDPWQNNLHSSFRGKYKGKSTGFRLGTTYKLNRNWSVGAAASYTGPLQMAGHLNVAEYTLEGLNLDAKDDEDLLDATEIDLDEPTRTVLEASPVAEILELTFPTSVGAGLSGKMGFLGLSLNVSRYFGEWSYRFDVAEDGEQTVYYHALKMKHGVRLGLDFTIIRLGIGLANGAIFDDPDEATGDSILIPTLSLGTGFKVNRSFSADFLVFGVPSGVGKVTLHYNL